MNSPQVAIVGSGPSGFYVADALLRKLPHARIDMFDRLPTPFGLVRGGVAPDHQRTKNIARQFERTLARPGVRFLGHVEIGADLSYEELKSAYDILVVCIGAFADHRLGIPGENLPGVYGSAAFVGWYNGVPDHNLLEPRLDGKAAAVVGNGNVALDVVRILAKSPAELAQTDLCQRAAARLAQCRLADLYLIGRRGPAYASFTPTELNELGHLTRGRLVVDAADIPAALPDTLELERRADAEKNLALLRSFALEPHDDRPLRIHLLFNRAPRAVLGEDRCRALRLAATQRRDGADTPEEHEIEVGTVVTAIGYRSTPFPGLPFDAGRGIVANDRGRVEPGVYAAGWCRRGPQGVIPANRADSLAVAELILADLAATRSVTKPGAALTDALLAQRHARAVDYRGWQKISAAESGRAGGGKPREKFTAVEELLAAALDP